MIPLPEPMKAVPGRLPDDDDGWAYEIKWDGMRVVLAVEPTTDGAALRAVSANGIDVTKRFPELEGLADHLAGHSVVLDGEVVAFEGALSSFARLQQRMHVDDRLEAARRALEVPVCFVVFDLLHLDGLDTFVLALADRHRLLAGLVEAGPHWRVSEHSTGDGAALLDAARCAGLEGIMAKRLASPYQPGKRSPMWRKIKVRRVQELVVGGWTTGEGSRALTLGALLLGYHPDADGGPLRFAGGVGTGFDNAEADRLRTMLDSLAADSSPFDAPAPPTVRNPQWVRPELVVQVEFAEWTPSGRLRHPSYVGQRIDTDPASVDREDDP